jgi:uncharacterized membrane protein YagU involved in acid resistance
MRPNIRRAIVGGFVGTIIFTLMMRFVAPMMGVRMDIPGKLGAMMHAGMAGGLFMHFLNGTVIFPLIYAYLFYRWLPGVPWQKGLLWGVILWLGVEIVMMPMIGGGFFSSQIGGRRAVVAALIGHLIYGSIFGGIAGGAPPAVVTRMKEAA